MYDIPINRYYELAYFCTQYPDWCREYKELQGSGPEGADAAKAERLARRIALVDKIAGEVFPSVHSIEFSAVINGVKLRDAKYRKFFWRLDQERD